MNKKENNILDISLDETPEYEIKFLARTSETNEEEIIEILENEYTTITYRFFEVSLNDETKE